MAYSPRFLINLKNLIGNEPVELILQNAGEAKILQREAEKFAESLHPYAHGAFINSRIEYGRDAVELILSKWFEKEEEKDDVTKEQAIDRLAEALEGAGKRKIARELRMFSSPPRIVTDLPSKPIPIPDVAQLVTSTAPVPSFQGVDNTCASHAIGKAIVAIFDDCGFDMINGELGQQKVIDDLVREVQPDRKARNPDKFHRRRIKVNIVKQPGRNHEIEIELDVQTVWNNTPMMTTKQLKDKKMRMVVRYYPFPGNKTATHAIYCEEYDHQKGHISVNSWGNSQDPKPVLFSSVYAIDYIQISEIC